MPVASGAGGAQACSQGVWGLSTVWATACTVKTILCWRNVYFSTLTPIKRLSGILFKIFQIYLGWCVFNFQCLFAFSCVYIMAASFEIYWDFSCCLLHGCKTVPCVFENDLQSLLEGLKLSIRLLNRTGSSVALPYWALLGPWSSRARAQIRAAVVWYATGVAVPDPLTHCAGVGIKPTPPLNSEPLQLDS